MARRRKGNDIHGILLLDKRLGISSNKALQEVKIKLNARKAGHTGSLDPLATGLLPLCFGEATKVSSMMLDDDKRYQVSVRLGVLTATGDAEGEVLKKMPVPILSELDVQECLQQFCGEIEQVPPMYSALKYQGRKLYELAREGVDVERKPRRIKIYSCQLLRWTNDILSLEVHCSKGTYIRSLAEDIGDYLGTCATVAGLRRIHAGQFKIEDALSWEQLQEMTAEDIQRALIAVDKPLQSYPAINVSNEDALRINQGQQLNLNENLTGTVRMYDEQGFLGLGEMLRGGKLAPRKLFNLMNSSV